MSLNIRDRDIKEVTLKSFLWVYKAFSCVRRRRQVERNGHKSVIRAEVNIIGMLPFINASNIRVSYQTPNLQSRFFYRPAVVASCPLLL
jgi:hypothetical protein